MDEAVLNLELTVAEINTVLRVLGKHPFDEVFLLINKIKTQGQAQLAELEAQQSASTEAQLEG